MKRRMTFAEEDEVATRTVGLCCRWLREHLNLGAARELQEIGTFWIIGRTGRRGTSQEDLKQESAIRQTSQVAKVKDEEVAETYAL